MGSGEPQYWQEAGPASRKPTAPTLVPSPAHWAAAQQPPHVLCCGGAGRGCSGGHRQEIHGICSAAVGGRAGLGDERASGGRQWGAVGRGEGDREEGVHRKSLPGAASCWRLALGVRLGCTGSPHLLSGYEAAAGWGRPSASDPLPPPQASQLLGARHNAGNPWKEGWVLGPFPCSGQSGNALRAD